MKTKQKESAATIEQLYELMPHMQAGRVTRTDIQRLIETAGRRGLEDMLQKCIAQAWAITKEIEPPENVKEKIVRGEDITGQNIYVEIATYERVRIFAGLYMVTREDRFLDLAYLSLDTAHPHLHPYEEAMIRLRIAEVTSAEADYKAIIDLASRGPDGFAKRVTILCDLALISGKLEYFELAKTERSKLTNPSHITLADEAIEYMEHRKSCSEPSKIVLARDDILFPKFSSFLLQNSEAGGGAGWNEVIALISQKQHLQQEYARCVREEWDAVKRNIRLFYLAIACAVCGDTLFARSIMDSHGFDRHYRDRMENIFAKVRTKGRRLDGLFMAAASITDPYLKADVFLVTAREIKSRLKK